MKVLHLFSNYKWTGPAEPALNLCLALRKLGVEADFACGRAPGHVVNRIIEEARARGIEPLQSMRLPKYRHPVKNLLDRRALARLLDQRGYHIVHCHLDNDHEIASGIAENRHIPLVRSSYHGEGFPNAPRAHRLSRHPVFLIEPSCLALENDAAINWSAQALACAPPRGNLIVIPGAVDTDRFDPGRTLPDLREKLGIPPHAFVVGIVARMQTHRHYEDLWDAAERLAADFAEFHVLVVGRGTNQEIVGKGPVRARGLAGRVHFSGYVAGDDYVAALKAFDVKVFLVPGSDGTCRAVREAMAMGKPAVVARRGMLPEIVDTEVNGIVFENSAVALYEALAKLLRDPKRVLTMGAAARKKAETDFSLDVQARRVLDVYERVLASPEV